MKNILIAIIASLLFVFNANAQQRTKMADGIYLVSYGNTFVIENEILQRTETLSVKQEKNSFGEEVYEVLCGNSYSKTVTKYALTSAVSAALTASGVGAWATGLAAALTSTIYEEVCDYYDNKYN